MSPQSLLRHRFASAFKFIQVNAIPKNFYIRNMEIISIEIFYIKRKYLNNYHELYITMKYLEPIPRFFAINFFRDVLGHRMRGM